MRKLWSLGWQFWIWTVGGLFAIIIGLPWAKQSCPEPSRSEQLFADTRPSTASPPSTLSHIPALLCEETKFTDLLLAYFTYCLVIVGWFTIRNSERTVQNLERAFLSVSPTKITTLSRSANVNGVTAPFVRLTLYVHNTGRTFATITKLYAEFSQTAPDGDTPSYHGECATEFPADLSLAANSGSDLLPHLFDSTFYSEPIFFWGYVEYVDIFKVKHISRVCAALFPNPGQNSWKFQAAGSEAWREWDWRG